MRAAQGDYQALAKLAAEEPRLTRLKVRNFLKIKLIETRKAKAVLNLKSFLHIRPPLSYTLTRPEPSPYQIYSKFLNLSQIFKFF